MRRLRFALALAAVGAASSVKPAHAFDACPIAWVYRAPWGTCGYTGHGSCPSTCEYTCENGWTGAISCSGDTGIIGGPG
jgi:hypothetical protein